MIAFNPESVCQRSKKTEFFYPLALVLIILFAGYFQKPRVDLIAYQRLCGRYRDAAAGRYSHEQIRLLVYKIDYLCPVSPDKLKLPAERPLKRCAQQLASRLQ